MHASSDAVHLIIGLGFFCANKQQTGISVVKTTQSFEDLSDCSMNPKASVGENCDVFKQLETVAQVDLESTPTRDHETKNQQFNRSKKKTIQVCLYVFLNRYESNDREQQCGSEG